LSFQIIIISKKRSLNNSQKEFSLRLPFEYAARCLHNNVRNHLKSLIMTEGECIMDKLYTASATAARGGRTGKVRTSDGKLDLDLSMPKEMGGSGGEGTNPEQLFAAGYSACFESAVAKAARDKGVKAEGAEVTARVSIGKDNSGGFQLAVQMELKVPGMDAAQAQELAEAAHQVCPYSKATRGNIEVELKGMPSEQMQN
jgi:lipoyl-dependent peroxiredoxin